MDHFFQLVFGFGFRFRAGLAGDAFPAAVVADGYGGLSKLAALVPVKAAVSWSCEAWPGPQHFPADRVTTTACTFFAPGGNPCDDHQRFCAGVPLVRVAR